MASRSAGHASSEVDFNSLDVGKKSKLILRDIYESEEMKIDSSRSTKLKETINVLCINGDEEFDKLFAVVNKDIGKIRKENTGGNMADPLLVEMYRYQAEDLPERLKSVKLNKDSDSIRDPLLWQMIVERLFIGNLPIMLQPQVEGSIREFSAIEENAIFYATGYVVRKLLKKYRAAGDDEQRSSVFVEALLNMVGEDSIDMECNETYLDYVKVWSINADRGGLIHASNDAYLCFKLIETATYNVMKDGKSKEDVVSTVLTDKNVLYIWKLAVDISDETISKELLLEIITLWFTIRGFSISSRLFEQYKQINQKTIKGTKGLRKEIH